MTEHSISILRCGWLLISLNPLVFTARITAAKLLSVRPTPWLAHLLCGPEQKACTTTRVLRVRKQGLDPSDALRQQPNDQATTPGEAQQPRRKYGSGEGCARRCGKRGGATRGLASISGPSFEMQRAAAAHGSPVLLQRHLHYSRLEANTQRGWLLRPK